jgi:general secretion pathway protein J
MRPRGFTLVEVLVALLAMAVLAALSWQGLSMLMRAKEANSASLAATQRINGIALQWEQDLLALTDTEVVPALQFDGRALRLTRRGREPADGVLLVVWSLDGGQWRRWVSPPQRAMAGLQEVWLRSQQLQADDPAQVLLAEGIESWQLYYFRGGAWSNAQSTGDLAALPPPPQGRLRVAPAASQPAGSSAPPPGSGAAAGAQPVEGAGSAQPPGAAGGPGAAGAPGSAGPAPAAPGAAALREALPAAVRLQIALDAQRTLRRDIALAPGASP